MDNKYIKGSFSRSFYEGNNGYLIGILKLKETNVEAFEDYINRTITFTGYFDNLNQSDTYIFYGNEVTHPKFGLQFNVTSYEVVKPTDKLGVISFLSSDLFPGIGEAIAKSIVEVLGEKALDVILENPEVLISIPKLNEKKRNTIVTNLIKYDESHKVIVFLSNLGFNMREALLIYNLYKDYSMDKVNNDIYGIIDNLDIPFLKIDRIALNMGYKLDDLKRIKACIIYSMMNITYSSGYTCLTKDEIYNEAIKFFRTDSYEYRFEDYLNELDAEGKIVIDGEYYYLKGIWDDEKYIVNKIKKLSNVQEIDMGIDDILKKYQEDIGITYNEEQENAIKNALLNNITIITGGPGTGKTTIIKAIVDIYSRINRIDKNLDAYIALLAPTGRASKRMAEACKLGASTIHRFLKWNKEDGKFSVNEFNRDMHSLIIVDEVSMIDIPLFASLLKGLNDNIKLVLVGDYNQLPSVGPGELLKDMIDSDMVNTICLEQLYRQDEDSYIVTLASEIKNDSLSENFLEKKSDYMFSKCSSFMIKESLKNIVSKMIEKDINMNKVQIMAPMYKGENGIDNLNKVLQSILNPSSNDKREINSGDVIYREGDKILELVNMPDDNVYNGDIGYITRIDTNKGKDEIYVSFDGNIVKYTPKDFVNITHGYIISIHKSQGSEFDTVILPMSHSYNRMLYRKLIYTAVTRAKRKLMLLGEPEAFISAVSKKTGTERRTDLKNKLINMYNSK